jgi:hypothetical protein
VLVWLPVLACLLVLALLVAVLVACLLVLALLRAVLGVLASSGRWLLLTLLSL